MVMARFILLVLTTVVAAVERKEHGTYRRLRQHLLEDHDKHVLPRLDHRHPIEVSIEIFMGHLAVDEMKSTISLGVFIRLNWRNDFLTWNSSDYGGIDLMHFGGQELWKPDILLYNGAYVHNIELPNNDMRVYSDGDVVWLVPAHLVAFCPLDLKYWPADKHDCILNFASWAHSGENISLVEKFDPYSPIVTMLDFTDNGEWHMDYMFGDKSADNNPCCNLDYTYANFVVMFQRQAPAYKLLIILPCLLLMLIAGCSFLLMPASGEKLLLSGLALIGTLMYLVYFSAMLPFYQSSVPIIVTLYANMAALIVIVMLLNVMCLGMVREKKCKSPPKLLTRTFSGIFGKLLRLGSYMQQASPTTCQRLSVELLSIDDRDESCRTEDERLQDPLKDSIIKRDWILVAAGIERMLFIIYAIVFAVVTSMYA